MTWFAKGDVFLMGAPTISGMYREFDFNVIPRLLPHGLSSQSMLHGLSPEFHCSRSMMNYSLVQIIIHVL